MQSKILPISWYKRKNNYQNSDLARGIQINAHQRKSLKHYKTQKTENDCDISLSPFSRFQNKKSNPCQQRQSYYALNSIIKKGQTQRSKTLKSLHPLTNRSGSQFKEISLNKKLHLPTQQQESIKVNLRNSINVGKRTRKNGQNLLQKKLVESFNRIVKELKHKTLARREEVNNKNVTRIQCYGASIKGDRHNFNQDSIIFSDKVYIVCDGHGANGKQISEFVSKTAHNLFQEALSQNKIDFNIIRNILKKTQMELDISGIDIAFSGCTFLSAIISDNNVYSINIGDSKAILCQGITTFSLCTLHKPDNLLQKLRIQQCGGIIHPLEIGKDKYSGPNRIWAPGKNSWGPGLALSRAFGDKAARKYGVICQPQIRHTHLTYETDFIVLGSDGLFDCMKDSQISFFVRKKLKEEMVSKEDIATSLVQQAKRIAGCDADDISSIIILL